MWVPCAAAQRSARAPPLPAAAHRRTPCSPLLPPHPPPQGTSVQTPCGTDSKFSAAGAANCTACSPGSFTGGGDQTTRTACSSCPAGHECDGTSSSSVTCSLAIQWVVRRSSDTYNHFHSRSSVHSSRHQPEAAVRRGHRVRNGWRRELRGVCRWLFHGRRHCLVKLSVRANSNSHAGNEGTDSKADGRHHSDKGRE